MCEPIHIISNENDRMHVMRSCTRRSGAEGIDLIINSDMY